MYVRDIDFASDSTIFLLDFATVPTTWYFLFYMLFFFFLVNCDIPLNNDFINIASLFDSIPNVKYRWYLNKYLIHHTCITW